MSKRSTRDDPPASEPLEPRVLNKKEYEAELDRLQTDLVALQEWVRAKGLRVAVLFEGRDTAGKGGTIKRVAYRMNPRFCRIVALDVPTDREQSQWYFQRYVTHLPAAGEIVLFDRSWYNRAGVETVMGFCTDDQYRQFLEDCPVFENMLIRDGIILIKYWLSVSDEEQRRRFKARMDDPARRWKLSALDFQAQAKWVDYAEAKDTMFAATDTEESPWWDVAADNKKSARLNVIAHLLSQIPYESLPDEKLTLPARQRRKYERPPIDQQRFVPTRYVVT